MTEAAPVGYKGGVEQAVSTPAESDRENLIPELAEYRRQFERIQQEVRELTSGLAESQFNWRPDETRWSISENLLHLNIAGDMWRRQLEETIERARASGPFSQGPFRYGFLGSQIVRSMEPPPKRKFRTGRRFLPTNGNPISAVVPTFLHYQDEFILRVQQANGLDLARIKLPFPAMRLIRLGLGQVFALILAHERRHLWQARQVRQHPQFPAEGAYRGRPTD